MKDRAGNPLLRPKGTPPPCWECPKENPSKADQYELTPENMAAVRYYLECKGIGGLPDVAKNDTIVRKNAGVLEGAFIHHKSQSDGEMRNAILNVMQTSMTQRLLGMKR